ncbi:MAG: hypothetical protein AB7I01_16920 [Gammaproteobacteria bacterium]
MSRSPHTELLYTLAPIGLERTLIATERPTGLAVHRVTRNGGKYRLEPLGALRPQRFAAIGRVAAPEALLRMPWRDALTFYGRWYDELASADRSYRLRRKIAQVPRETQVAQLLRDDKYALVGTYYAVFQAIMAAKQRVPLVLLNSSFLEEKSFPVLLPREAEDPLYRDLETLLSGMLKPEHEREAREAARAAANGRSAAGAREPVLAG